MLEGPHQEADHEWADLFDGQTAITASITKLRSIFNTSCFRALLLVLLFDGILALFKCVTLIVYVK